MEAAAAEAETDSELREADATTAESTSAITSASAQALLAHRTQCARQLLLQTAARRRDVS
jgi:hypothetical protein